MTIVTSYLPIDIDQACNKGGLYYERLFEITKQHYTFEQYKALVNERIPEVETSLNNGSLCKEFVQIEI